MAVDEFTTVLRLDRSWTSAYWDRATAYLALGQYQLAIHDLDKNIQVGSSTGLHIDYNWRGYAYYNLGQYEMAIGDYNEAIRLSGKYTTAYFNRSWAYRRLGKYAEADADKAKACSLDSQYC